MIKIEFTPLSLPDCKIFPFKKGFKKQHITIRDLKISGSIGGQLHLSSTYNRAYPPQLSAEPSSCQTSELVLFAAGGSTGQVSETSLIVSIIVNLKQGRIILFGKFVLKVNLIYLNNIVLPPLFGPFCI